MRLKALVIGLAALGGVALTTGTASAMPNGIPQADQIASPPAKVEQVRWVCNRWGRCWHRPNWRGAYGFYRPGWRWHRWHRWHRF